MTAARVLPWTLPAVAGQLQLGSLVMGAGTPYPLQRLEGFDLPPITQSDSPRAGADGSFSGLDSTAVRSLIFHMLLKPDMVSGIPSKSALGRTLKGAFQESQQDVGIVYNDPDLGGLLSIGRPRRVSYVVDRQYPWLAQDNVLAQFDGMDPLLYSAALYGQIIGYGTAGTNAGLPFNASGSLGMTFEPLRIIQNGGFESAAAGDGGWVTTVATDLAAGATLTRDTGTFDTGVASGKLVTSGASINQGVRQPTLTNLLPNTSYTFWVRVNLATAGGSIRLLARDVTNAVLASSAGVVNTTGSWQALSVTLVTGATGPVGVMLTIRDEGTAVTRTFFVDGVRGDLASSVQGYAAPLSGATFGAISGGAGAAGFATLVNAGNENFAPVSRISAALGPVTGPLRLERVESGEVITLNFSMSTGDVLELDHDLHSVLLNGVTNRSDIVDASTAWWSMRPGNNTIHYRTDGPGSGSSAEIKWRDAYW